jgi:hypothetical protein
VVIIPLAPRTARAMHAGIVAAAAAMLCASVVSYLLVRSHVTHTNTG